MTISSHTLHLTVAGADAASRWYAAAFGAIELARIQLPGDKLIHVQLQIGDLRVTLADEFPELESFGPAHFGGTYGATYLHVDDVDAAWERAISAGAETVRPVADAFWGEREGQLRDPFGHRWGLTEHLLDIALDELQRRATAAFSGEGLH
ncbi:VOC family protein [Nakamurella lactea]|uniref:VOC family protein n=1 Tax=Nakamurella lactea TaxID=459515 RepID=UPI00048BBC6D|nr:VOC family protein [Nakamurella lactea]